MSPIRDKETFCKCFLADTAEEAEELMVVFEKDISMLAGKFASFARNIDRLDLEQEGLIGLARAKRDFEEGRSEKFRIFAIYKIKDAMREFVTSQSNNIRVPQYIREALRLSDKLKKSMEKAGYTGHASLTDLWDMSLHFKAEPPIVKDIIKTRNSLKNLADRSHTAVKQLLERAEIMPIPMSTAMDMYDHGRLDGFSNEDSIASHMATKQSVKKLRELLTEDEFDLLHARFVEGRTVRELAPELGISAPSVVTRTNGILERLERNKKRILHHESDTDTEETESGYGG